MALTNKTIASTYGDILQVENSGSGRTASGTVIKDGLGQSTALTLGQGDHLLIKNTDADDEAYVEDNFKIDSLTNLDEKVATFSLTSWLQFFKLVLPSRKYYKNTCQWIYKGEECQYPGPAGGTIPGTSLSANTNPIAANNQTAGSIAEDECGKSFESCQIRNNTIHFGGFPGTGRTIPK